MYPDRRYHTLSSAYPSDRMVRNEFYQYARTSLGVWVCSSYYNRGRNRTVGDCIFQKEEVIVREHGLVMRIHLVGGEIDV